MARGQIANRVAITPIWRDMYLLPKACDGTLPIEGSASVPYPNPWFKFCASVSVALLAWAVPQTGLAKEAFDRQGYEAAIARAQSGAADVDYLFLRQQAAISHHYAFPRWDDLPKADAALDSAPARSLALAQARLKDVWVDMFAHAVARMALIKLGRTAEAAQEKTIIDGLIRSIMGGHSGKSAQDAFNAVTIDEEYAFLALGGMKTQRQALSNVEGHNFDVMTVKSAQDSGEELTLWFNIDSFFGKEFQ